jgi:phosphate transport system permease protein
LPREAFAARYRIRRATSAVMTVLCAASVVLALIPLGLILFLILRQGIPALDLAFFTEMPKPVGEAGGGMANAIVGTGILIGLAGLIAVPIGITCGVYIVEFRTSRLAPAVRFAADLLNGVPSIVVGIFAYALVVVPFKRFSALAGGVALAVMMIPIIVRTTEELLALVPESLREGALALGATRGRAVISVILPAALPGIVTGVLVALARVAGETAPLLFTALNNRFFSTALTQPIASLTVQIYTYANSPYDDWHRQAWAGSTVLITAVLLFSLLARAMTRRLERMHRG